MAKHINTNNYVYLQPMTSTYLPLGPHWSVTLVLVPSTLHLELGLPNEWFFLVLGCYWEHEPKYQVVGVQTIQVFWIHLQTQLSYLILMFLILLLSSLTLYNPLGAIRFEWLILSIYAFNMCFSFPGNGGYDYISLFSSPVKIYLIYLLHTNYYLVTCGNNYQSSVKS